MWLLGMRGLTRQLYSSRSDSATLGPFQKSSSTKPSAATCCRTCSQRGVQADAAGRRGAVGRGKGLFKAGRGADRWAAREGGWLCRSWDSAQKAGWLHAGAARLWPLTNCYGKPARRRYRHTG